MRKKIISAVAVSAVLLCGCGKTVPMSETVSEEQPQTFAEVLSEHLDSGDYDLKFSISGGSLDKMQVEIKRFGEDGFVSMDNSGVYSEFVKVEKQTYMLLPEIRCFKLGDEYGTFGNAFIKLGEGDSLAGVTEEAGKTIEVYRCAADSDGSADTFTFVFDTEKGAQGLEQIIQQTEDGTTEIEIESVSFSCEPISLPDLSDYDNISDSEMIEETTQVKFYLYYTFGISEEKAAEMGIDYYEVAHLDYDSQQEYYDELKKQLKGNESNE